MAGLAECGATVHVVAPEVLPEIEAMDGVTVERRPYRRGEVAAWIWGIGIRRLVDALRRSRPPAGELTEFAGVETFIASGNVIFSSAARSEPVLLIAARCE